MIPFLVIGFGNDLRGDDAVGRHVARIVASWQRPEVRALEVHQLTPELAEPLSLAERAVFVDARMSDPERGVELSPLESMVPEGVPGHRSDPAWLLALTDALYEYRPQSWLLSIPVTALGLGDTLSAKAQAGMTDALERIAQWTLATRDHGGVAGDA